MHGKTMIVCFFAMGPLQSEFTVFALQVTDSFYVAHSELVLVILVTSGLCLHVFSTVTGMLTSSAVVLRISCTLCILPENLMSATPARMPTSV